MRAMADCGGEARKETGRQAPAMAACVRQAGSAGESRAVSVADPLQTDGGAMAALRHTGHLLADSTPVVSCARGHEILPEPFPGPFAPGRGHHAGAGRAGAGADGERPDALNVDVRGRPHLLQRQAAHWRECGQGLEAGQPAGQRGAGRRAPSGPQAPQARLVPQAALATWCSYMAP